MGCGASKNASGPQPGPQPAAQTASVVAASSKASPSAELAKADADATTALSVEEAVRRFEQLAEGMSTFLDGDSGPVAACLQGLERWGQDVANVLSVAIPPPGGTVVGAVVAVVAMAARTFANKRNCKLLAAQAVEVGTILMEHRGELVAGGRALERQVQDVEDVIRRALDYTSRFADKNWLEEVLSLATAAQECTLLSQEITEACSRLQFAAGAAGFARVQELARRQKEVDAADLKLKADLEAALAESGGSAERLFSDSAAFSSIVTQLKGGEKLIAEGMRDQFALLQSLKDDSEKKWYDTIDNPHLRAFWKTYCKEFKIEWEAFWSAFPKKLTLPEPQRRELQELLSQEEVRLAFEEAVDQTEPETISAFEVSSRFGESDDLVSRVRDLVAEGRQIGARARCWLPPPSQHFAGREEEVQKLQSLLTGGSRLVVVHGPLGYGKAQALFAAAQRAAEAGQLPGGGYRADLLSGGIGGEDGLVAKLVSALRSSGGPSDREALRALAAALGSWGRGGLRRNATGAAGGKPQGPPPRCLLLLDHADEVLGSAELCATLQSLLENTLLPLAPGLVVGVSARSMPPLTGITHPVSSLELSRPLSPPEAAQLLRSVCPGLAPPQAAAVAERTQGVPLLVWLAGQALSHGRQSADSLDLEGVLADSASRVERALAPLPRSARRNLVFLSLFPGPFTRASAEKVLGCLSVRASRQALEALLGSGLLQRCSDRRRGADVFELQWVVRSALSSAWSASDERLEGLGLSGEELVAAARRFVLAQAATLSERSSVWRVGAVGAYYLAGVEKHAVEQALRLHAHGFEDLVEGPEGGDSGAGGSLVGVLGGMLLDLHTVDVHEHSSIRALLSDLRPVFARCRHPLGLTACAVVGARAAEQQADSWREAAAQVTAAIEPHLSPSPPSDPALLRACAQGLRGLGVMARDGGDPEGSVAHLQRALGLLGGAGAEARAGAWFATEEALCTAELAGSLDYLGPSRCEEGAQVAARALELARAATAGGDGKHPLVALCLGYQGFFLKAQGLHEEAVAAHRQAMDIRLHVFGPDHPDVATALNQAAISLIELGRHAQADTDLAEALRIRRTALGPQHFMVANTLLQVASLRLAQAQPRAAQEALREAAALYTGCGLRPKAAKALLQLAGLLEAEEGGAGAEEAAALRAEAAALQQ
ncbi:hypothetical protein HYH03_013540 [Edaphochlamys debaryana]|uniref:Uncharacterized protein n=1 Tax=Edaphochlamys debaryana TaxID=47281 RepID=A0A835XRW7_9CHLO|nr:hypothetical protein HYH03_013540 [Edaphochlamys debaryana]|eukprot:KAG2487823.1 hypothetical protein HYH03_013540 [Edaphochlamys debaryana]